MRTILHVGKYYPPHRGGIESYLRDLVRSQSAEFAVRVLVANDSLSFGEEQIDGAMIARVSTFGTVASMPITPTLPWNIAARKADIVHLHLPNPWAALALLLSGHSGRIVVTHHGDTLGRRALRTVTGPFVKQAMRRADAIIVSSAKYRDSSSELAPYRSKCRVVPLGLDPTPFETADPRAVDRIRAQYGQRLILSVGRLVPYKGLRYLIAAMADTDASLLHIGTGPLRVALLEQARESRVADRVHMLGHVDDLVPYLHAAAMLVLPSITRAESFGIVQLEAMAAGIPIVNTAINSGVPEVSPHGLTGLTVPPGDSAALGCAIRQLLDDPLLARTLGGAGRERVRQQFSIERMAAETRQVYKNVLNESVG